MNTSLNGSDNFPKLKINLKADNCWKCVVHRWLFRRLRQTTLSPFIHRTCRPPCGGLGYNCHTGFTFPARPWLGLPSKSACRDWPPPCSRSGEGGRKEGAGHLHHRKFLSLVFLSTWVPVVDSGSSSLLHLCLYFLSKDWICLNWLKPKEITHLWSNLEHKFS